MPHPPIRFERHQAVCQCHSEPFRNSWPRGWPAFHSALWQATLMTPDFQDAVEDNVEACRRLLNKRPMCSWLEADRLLYLYESANKLCEKLDGMPLWQRAHCFFCHGRRAAVSNFQVKKADTLTRKAQLLTTLPHVCLHCLVRQDIVQKLNIGDPRCGC